MTFGTLRVVLLMTAVAATACLIPAQADTYWHLRAGNDLFTTGHVPLVDTYSHTARGLPWPNHEWLWQALSYSLYHVGGMPLLTAVGAAFATLAAFLSLGLARARPSLNFVLALVGIALSSVVWALRPQVASLLFLVVLVRLLVAQRFWLIPPLFVVWANLHGAVALGGMALVAALVVAWFGDRQRWKRLALVTVLAGQRRQQRRWGSGCGGLSASRWRVPGRTRSWNGSRRIPRAPSRSLSGWRPSFWWR